MRIIAFSGKKQSGKTTAVTDLWQRIGPERLHQVDFADKLKRIVCTCFGAEITHLFGGTDSQKNKLLPCGKSGREVLQIVGTDWFRSLDPDCWVRAYRKCLACIKSNSIVLTSDVRFPNEVKCIQDLGGHVIRLLRNPHDDQHESETALDAMEIGTLKRRQPKLVFDAIIDNRNMTIAEQNEAIWKLTNERGWL